MRHLRRYIAILFLLLYIINCSAPIQEAEAATKFPKVKAHAYVVMDANSGKILFSKYKSKKIYPASTIKLMTAIVAIENGKLKQKIMVKKSVLKKLPDDATTVGLKAGQTYTLEQLLNLMLIASAADAAETLAVGTCKSTKSFIKKMNQEADKLGLSHTSFDNTIGLDIGNGYKKTYSTASDIAKLARYAMSIKTIRNIVSKKTYKLSKVGKIKSTNRFYFNASYSADRYTIIGAKTGTTDAAGHALVSASKDSEGHEIICAFFGKGSGIGTYKDSRKLIDYTFHVYDKGNLTITRSFFDVRYRSSESKIRSYCTAGLIDMTKTGEFKPSAKVKQGEFVDTLNRICETDLVAEDDDNYITVKDFAQILYQTYPIVLSEDEMYKLRIVLGNMYPVSQEELTELTELYSADILPAEYAYDIDTYITKEDMILIADKLDEYIKGYPSFLMLASH